MADIAGKNLALMKSAERGGMDELLCNESFGGNARSMPDGHPCAGANFYFDKDSGEIKYFGNFQDVPKEIRRYPSGIFRVAIDWGRTWACEIVGAYYDAPSGKLERLAEASDVSNVAKQVLQQSVSMYNSSGNNASCVMSRSGGSRSMLPSRVLSFLKEYLRL